MPVEGQPSPGLRIAGWAFVALTLLGLVALGVLIVLAAPLVVLAFPLTITFSLLGLAIAYLAHRRRTRGR